MGIFLSLWAGRDSNPRRQTPPGLQPGTIDRSVTDPYGKSMNLFSPDVVVCSLARTRTPHVRLARLVHKRLVRTKNLHTFIRT